MNEPIISHKDEFLQNLLSGNRQKCSSLSKQYLSINPSIKDLYEKVIKESLYEVGRLWETNKITVASEHLATAITESILNELYENLDSGVNRNKNVVLTCVENELHQVGIKMVADVFEMNGWESFFLGTGIPILELVNYLNQAKPSVLAISLSVFFNYQNLIRMIDLLKDEFSELNIIVGGQAFKHKTRGTFNITKRVKYISNLYELDEYLKTF